MDEQLNDQQQLRNRTNAALDGNSAGHEEQRRGISPLDPSSMPRAEDDEQTYAQSPEYHDRVPNDPREPQQGAASEGYRYGSEGTTNPSEPEE